MSVQPAYAAVPLDFGPVQISTANTNRDGTGTISTIAVGRRPGTRIERVRVHGTGTIAAATMVRIFKKGTGLTRNADGTVASYAAPTWRLIAEIPIGTVTPSGSVAASDAEWAPTDGYNLADGEQLGASTHTADTFNVEAQGAHL